MYFDVCTHFIALRRKSSIALPMQIPHFKGKVREVRKVVRCWVYKVDYVKWIGDFLSLGMKDVWPIVVMHLFQDAKLLNN